jgi:hypothetical protein
VRWHLAVAIVATAPPAATATTQPAPRGLIRSAVLLAFAGFSMLRNAFDMGLGCLGLLVIGNWHLIGCQNRWCLIASSATPPPTTTTLAVFSLLGCFSSHSANGIL